MARVIKEAVEVSEYVVAGARLSCTLGSAPATLEMPESHGVFLQGKAQCNVGDTGSLVNITCFGACGVPGNPPCVPKVGMPWVNNKETRLSINGQKALIKDANAFCANGGVISIDDSGQ